MAWKRLGADASWIFFSVALGTAVQWTVVILVARLKGPEGVGQYALAQSLVLPVVYFAWLSLRQHLVVDRDGGHRLRHYLLVRVTGQVILYTAASGSIFFVYSERALGYITAAIFATKFVDGLSDLAAGVLQVAGQARKVALLAAVRSLTSMAVFTVVFVSSQDLFWSLGMTAAAGMVCVCLLELPASRQAWPRPFGGTERETLTEIGRSSFRIAMTCLPLGAGAVLMSINAVLPRLLLDHFDGARVLGHFSVISHFVVIGALMASSLGQSFLPRFARQANEDRTALFRTLLAFNGLMIIIGGIAAIAAWIVGESILRLVYGAAFADQAPLLVTGALCSGLIYGASITAFGATAARAYRYLIPVYLTVTIANFLSGRFLIPHFGAHGAFLCQAIAGLVQIVAFFWAVKRRTIISTAVNSEKFKGTR
jgi:O-antigen/teichoic acid export membrane protein